MKTRIISAVALLVLSVGALRAETISVGTFGVPDRSDLKLLADLCAHKDSNGIWQMIFQRRCAQLEAGTQVSVLATDVLRCVVQVRPEGTDNCLWVPVEHVSK
jgi:hypothetical protein